MTTHPDIAGLDNSDAESDTTKEDSTPKEEEKLELAKRENKAVWMLRLFTTLILVLVAIAVCLSVYFQGRQSEQENFEVGFTELARKVVSSFELDVQKRVGILESFAMDLTSFVNQDANISWPFYTPADYERRAGLTAKLARVPYLHLLPRVETWQRQEWEAYSVANQGWIAEGLAIQQGVEPEDINARPIVPVMIRLKDGYPMVEDRPGPYFPVWMSYPASNFTSATNVNTYGEGERGFIYMNAALKKQRPTFPESNDFWNDEDKESSFVFQQIKYMVPSYEGSPFLVSYYPVFDSLGEDRQIVAFLLGASVWREYFDSILPEGAIGVYVVLDNACEQVFTFRLDGRISSFVDFGDLHDAKYDHLEVVTNVNSIVDTEGDDSEVTSGDCHYRIRVYPTQDFENRYYTKSPMLYAVALAVVFLFTCSVFLLYDYVVERRQKAVMKSATRSGKLVSSLFPEAVRNRLYEEEEAKNKDSRGKTWRTSRTEDEGGSDKMAIATLYPETTIFFADLAGFTKWSSTRTPVEVFELLEELYGAFDAIASRYHVFKVETIGDCYVAVTGLPEPQPNHAVLMVKFARACMSKIHTVTASLVDKLGEDTTTLEMRVGLHSGPVTAGVLRGKKSRFQLFGDSVNTASRMESNGIKGRLQCSQATADALIAAGKSHWLTPRAEKVLAKGKGEMQTYWVNITRSGPGTASSGGDTASLTASMAKKNVSDSNEREEDDQDVVEKAEKTIAQIHSLVSDPEGCVTRGGEQEDDGQGGTDWMLQTSRL